MQLQLLVLADVLQHSKGLRVQTLRLLSDSFVVEDLRVAPVGVPTAELPDLEERIPVNGADDVVNGEVLKDLVSNELGCVWDVLSVLPVNNLSLLTSIGERQILTILQSSVELLTKLSVGLTDILCEGLILLVQQRLDNGDGPGGIQDVDTRTLVLRCDLDRCVHTRGGGSTNQKWHLHSTLLHLLCDCHHFVKRWSDQTGETNHINLVLLGSVQNVVAVAHDTDVDNLEVVAPQHNTDNVLTDVVDITLHSCHENNTSTLLLIRILTSFKGFHALLLLHEGDEVGNSLLHHTGGLDHLRQEHLAGTE
mmetsp:Transcript_11436/g.13556  ORF Transcript_11436/g.13556 Transcript_11436/m.13556 type:complete len:308 (-) Transcript_11436:295-1218(-)